MKLFRLAAPLMLLSALAHAHIGSPDVYLTGQAGPYQLFVTVRPPLTIPGVAEIEVRSASPGVRQILAVPLAIAGAGSKFAPIPDPLKVSPQDPQFFTGSLWMMTSGSWQARLTVDGSLGQGVLSVPVPSYARASKTMQWGLGSILSVLGIFLAAGLVAIIGAASREAYLPGGEKPDAAHLRRGRRATIVGAIVVCAIVWGGKAWWNAEASDYDNRIYKPLRMSAALQGAHLTLQLSEPGWMQAENIQMAAYRVFTRHLDDLVPDHGHLMHLYAIRQPGLDVLYHLHPEQRAAGAFTLDLPSMPAGQYKLYADIVHSNGFPETMAATLDVPSLSGRPLAGDDAAATSAPWQKTSPSTVFELPDGYRMTWLRDKKALLARQSALFAFRLTKPDGGVPSDMALYMGMPGHAAFVKTDGAVFAHIHPNGSASMAAVMLAAGMPPGMDHSAMQPAASPPDTVTFPYGFPSPGRYRIFVQMKHGATVETGVFDALVSPSN